MFTRIIRTKSLAFTAVFASVALAATVMAPPMAGAISASNAKKRVSVIGYALSGPSNDHGYYQDQAQEIKKLGKKYGIRIIIAQNADPTSATVWEDLARQGAQVVIADGSEFTPGMVPFAKNPAFKKVLPLMISGDPPVTKNYATAGGNELEAHFLGGVAAALLLKKVGGNTACDVAGPKTTFIVNAAKAMEQGVKYVNPKYHFLVTYTGTFNNATLAASAAKSLLAQGCKVLYPYLGGAISAALNTAHRAGALLVATSYNRCGTKNPPIAMNILYNPALYLPKIVPALLKGEIHRGQQWRLFSVGSSVGVGATICNPSKQELKVMAAAKQKLATGKINVPKLIGSDVQG